MANHRGLVRAALLIGSMLPTPLAAQTGRGPASAEHSASAKASAVNELIAKTTVEILTLRPTMSLGLTPPGRE